MGDLLARFEQIWAELAPIGLRPDGGYDRLPWSDADLALRAWFRTAADERGLVVEQDRNGNLWAWWGYDPAGDLPLEDAVATGSHLDSVPAGGAYDGPLGVAAAFLAHDELRARYDTPSRPLGIVGFTEEEGSRFGVACLGSRLSVGALDPARARALTDAEGTSLADAMRAAGADPTGIGPDRDRLSRVAAFIELHVEQGRFLQDVGAPVGLATEIWPHGRWQLHFEGEANHAGTAPLLERKDPMLAFAATVTAARYSASARRGLATVGRVVVRPNATNAVAASVDAWLDARACDVATLDLMVHDIFTAACAASTVWGVTCSLTEESRAAAVTFDPNLRATVARALGGGVPEMSTGAGHDAGILAAIVPTAMLFVRNSTGVSHSPEEHADGQDCVEGVRSLTRVLENLVWG